MVIDTSGLIALSKSQEGLIEEFVVTTTTVRKHGVEDKAKLGMKTFAQQRVHML